MRDRRRAAASAVVGRRDQAVRVRADRGRGDLGLARRAAHDSEINGLALEVGDDALAVGLAQHDLDVGR